MSREPDDSLSPTPVMPKNESIFGNGPASKIHVLEVLWNMDQGGIEASLIEVLRRFDSDGFQIDFLVEETLPSSLEGEIRRLGGRVFRCAPLSRPLAFARGFRSILASNGPYRVVHSHRHLSGAYVLVLASMAGVPVRVAHSHSDTRAQQARAGAVGRLFQRWARWSTKRAMTAGLAVSEGSAAALFGESWRGDPRIQLYASAIDLRSFEEEVDRAAVRRELGLAPSNFVVGHVGRFVEAKNHAFLAEVFAQVAARRPDARLCLVGDGLGRPDIEAKVRAAGLAERVVFTGQRSDVPRLLLGAFDVFVLPSVREGLPRVLVEAQAAGLPCLVSDIVTREADVCPGAVARLPLAASPEAWAEELIRVGTSPGRPSRAEALDHCRRSSFNLEVEIRRLEQLYRSG